MQVINDFELPKKILTADDHPQVKRYRDYRKWLWNNHIRKHHRHARPIWEPLKGEPLKAVVNHGRWVVRCDVKGCNGAQFAHDSYGFFCDNCCNQSNEGHARPVIFPENRQEIETILLKRVRIEDRNWLPHESATDLKTQNLTHGERI